VSDWSFTNPPFRRTPELGFRVLLAVVAEAREEEYMPSDTYTRPYTVINVPKLHTL
jgi:hypothetical protein